MRKHAIYDFDPSKTTLKEATTYLLRLSTILNISYHCRYIHTMSPAFGCLTPGYNMRSHSLKIFHFQVNRSEGGPTPLTLIVI